MEKEHWLKLGENNTKYFHACVKQRRQSNKIYGIFYEGGIFYSNPLDVEMAFIEYFESMYSASNLVGMSHYLETIPSKVTLAMNGQFLAEFTKEEVLYALQHMAPFNPRVRMVFLWVFTKSSGNWLVKRFVMQY